MPSDAPDAFDLKRFLDAQSSVYEDVRHELRDGRKTSHWMWFVFPQIACLGHSPTARYFAISSLTEARAYLAHPILGARLRECAALVRDASAGSAVEIFGATDSLKLRSCMTLFSRAAPAEPVFGQVLDRFFGGRADAATDSILARAPADLADPPSPS